jgi:DNA polymerase
MIIGEAPGATEAAEGKPFIGAAGQLLQSILRSASIQMRQIYVTNIVKHRPPNNRKPSPAEQYTCASHFLIREIETVNPKLILCLGRTAAEALYLIENQKLPRGSLRGHRWLYKDYPAIATWHPAYILRNQDKHNELVEDIKEAFQFAQTLNLGSQNETFY